MDGLRVARLAKNLSILEVSRLLNIDKALLSKFESGQRNPTREQILALCECYGIENRELLILWLKEKILRLLPHEPFAIEALQAALYELQPEQSTAVPQQFEKLLAEMESLKSLFNKPG